MRQARRRVSSWTQAFVRGRAWLWRTYFAVLLLVVGAAAGAGVMCRRSTLSREAWIMTYPRERTWYLTFERHDTGMIKVFDSAAYPSSAAPQNGVSYGVITFQLTESESTRPIAERIDSRPLWTGLTMFNDPSRGNASGMRQLDICLTKRWLVSMVMFDSAANGIRSPVGRDDIDSAFAEAIRDELESNPKSNSDPVLMDVLDSPSWKTTRIYWPGVRYYVHHYYWKWFVWGVLAMGVLWAPVACRGLSLVTRRRRGACLMCGYNRRGLRSAKEVCPECGWV